MPKLPQASSNSDLNSNPPSTWMAALKFMAEFEDACFDLGIPLIVLPPAKLKYNGGIERGNRIFREEFYNRSDLLKDSIRGM